MATTRGAAVECWRKQIPAGWTSACHTCRHSGRAVPAASEVIAPITNVIDLPSRVDLGLHLRLRSSLSPSDLLHNWVSSRINRKPPPLLDFFPITFPTLARCPPFKLLSTIFRSRGLLTASFSRSVHMARVTRGSAAAKAEALQLSSPPATPPKPKKVKEPNSVPAESSPSKPLSLPATLKSNRKRSRAIALKEEDVNDLPHNLGRIPDLSVLKTKDENASPAKKARKSRAASSKKESATKAEFNPESSPRKKKKAKYGFTPGETPYPNWPRPTAEECYKVCELLSDLHGEVKPPKEIPEPSVTVAGCGEVPDVLDAMLRTLLSANTTGKNSGAAVQGLIQKFGRAEAGPWKGSIDWLNVYKADVKDIFEAIKHGGMGNVKSKSIRTILDIVWAENQARRDQLVSDGSPDGSMEMSAEAKQAEIEKTDAEMLSLNHLHRLSDNDAFDALTEYPGIGVKTAACVLLFCLQRPCFAVDTHVFRLCKWLGWVPPPGDPAGLPTGSTKSFTGPNEITTFAHCEVRVPNELKYPIHRLLITHGKKCGRCRAITGESSEGWDEGCVIEDLVKRTGFRKGPGGSPLKGSNGRTPKKSKIKPKPKPKPKAKAKAAEESDIESSELSELGSDDEDFQPT
jgi:endonuclease III